MPRKIRRADSRAYQPRGQNAQGSAWTGYVLTALVAAAIGAGSTYAALRPLRHAAPSPGIASPTISPAVSIVNGNSAFDQKQWNVAITDYSSAIQHGMDNPDVRTDLGTAYRNLHLPQQAMQQYEIAQKEDPDHQNSLINEGIVTGFDLGNPTQAVVYWKDYLKRFPHGAHVGAVKKLIAIVQTHSVPTKSQTAPA